MRRGWRYDEEDDKKNCKSHPCYVDQQLHIIAVARFEIDAIATGPTNPGYQIFQIETARRPCDLHHNRLLPV